MSVFGGRGSVFKTGPQLDEVNTWSAKQTFSGDIKLGIDKKIYLDDDNDSYIVCSADDFIDFYAGGVWVLRIDNNKFSMRQLIESTYQVKLYARGSPSNVPNFGFVYGKDVAGKCEVHCMDEDGNETQLSAHNKKGNFVIRSNNYKTGKNIEIQLEKLIRDKFPEYLISNQKAGNIPNGKLPVFTPIKYKWYQIIKKWRSRKCRIKQNGA